MPTKHPNKLQPQHTSPDSIVPLTISQDHEYKLKTNPLILYDLCANYKDKISKRALECVPQVKQNLV